MGVGRGRGGGGGGEGGGEGGAAAAMAPAGASDDGGSDRAEQEGLGDDEEDREDREEATPAKESPGATASPLAGIEVKVGKAEREAEAEAEADEEADEEADDFASDLGDTTPSLSLRTRAQTPGSQRGGGTPSSAHKVHMDVDIATPEGTSMLQQLLTALQEERDLREKKEIELQALQAKMKKLVKAARGRRPSLMNLG